MFGSLSRHRQVHAVAVALQLADYALWALPVLHNSSHDHYAKKGLTEYSISMLSIFIILVVPLA